MSPTAAIDLLRRLLACRPPGGGTDVMDLLVRLLAAAPPPGLITRRRTLFDVLGVATQETAHSFFLAWLLDPNGPLSDDWLLRDLFTRAVPERAWPGRPVRVVAELSEGGERPDIVALWDDFTLVIEYKIDSPETAGQVRRYLKTFGVGTSIPGVVLYITKRGEWPSSVAPGDPRVRPLSYEELVRLIDAGLASGREPGEKGRVLAREYREALARSIHRRFGMNKPVFSEGTRLLLSHHQQFKAIRDIALEESAEFVHWTSREAAARLRAVLGDDMDWKALTGVTYTEFIYRRPHWRIGHVDVAIGIGTTYVGERLPPEVDFYVGVLLPWPGAKEGQNALPAISAQLYDRYRELWPLGKLEPREDEWTLWQYCRFEASDDPDRWAEDVIGRLVKLAGIFAPHLDRFVASFAEAAAVPSAKGAGRRPGR